MASRAPIAGHPRRGEVWVVAFDPVRGREIAKTRPALIIQNDVGNRESDVVIVAAITTFRKGDHIYPVNVLVPIAECGLKLDSVVRLDQLRSVDKERLSSRVGVLSPQTMERVNRALQVSLGLIDLGH